MDDPDQQFARIATDGACFDAVVAALDGMRPALQSEGVDVKLIEIEDESIAIVELFGKCVGCPMSEITVRHGVEAHLRSAVPQILAVDVVSDRSLPVREFTDVLARASFRPISQ